MFWWWWWWRVLSNTLGPKCAGAPVGVQLGWDLVSVKSIANESDDFHTHQTTQWPLMPTDGGIVILEENTFIKIEIFHHRLKVIDYKTLYWFALTLLCKGKIRLKLCQQNAPSSKTEPPDPLTVCIRHSGVSFNLSPVCVLSCMVQGSVWPLQDQVLLDRRCCQLFSWIIQCVFGPGWVPLFGSCHCVRSCTAADTTLLIRQQEKESIQILQQPWQRDRTQPRWTPVLWGRWTWQVDSLLKQQALHT